MGDGLWGMGKMGAAEQITAARMPQKGTTLRGRGYGLWVMGYGLWVMGDGLRGMGYGGWVTGCGTFFL